jgi:hypothetical protein
MQKNTRKSKLGSYSVLAGSLLAAAGTANAQIKYSNVNPDSVLGFGEIMSIDLDTNGTPDFVINMTQVSSSSSSALNEALITVVGNPNNAVIGSLYSGYPIPTALNAGDSIKANSAWNAQSVNGGVQYLGLFYPPNTAFGNFPNTTNRFIGVRFSNGSQTFYGWIRISLNASVTQLTVNDYAYQSNGNAIQAGQHDIAGVEDLVQNSNVRIHSFEKTVYINVTDDQLLNGEVNITNMLGETVSQCELKQRAQQVDLSSFTTGMYFVTVRFGDKAVVKKVYIY